MNFHPAHPLQPFWNLAAAPVQTQALNLALDRGLFEALQQPASATQIAERLGLHAGGTAVWLDLLWSMDLLERDQREVPHYRISDLSVRFFIEGAVDNCAQAWQYRARVLGAFATQMDNLLVDGPSGEQPPGGWVQAAQVQISQEQQAVSVPAVLRLLERWPLAERGRFLDLGGGPGHIAIALARRLPGWTGTLGELLATAEVARHNIEQAGLGERLDVQGCDLDRDELAAGYDLIWCSSVLHFVHDAQGALEKMFAALNPGGRLIIAHAEIAADADLAAQVLPFYTAMRMRGKYVPRPGEIAQAMQRAGFVEVTSPGRAAFPMAPVWLHTGLHP
ncbi:methyltransferase domain-containing protein [Pseudomonas sp. LRF_L74]|uniref:methyltransferase domain-containing protein n=1 Tax=Pseudomonas sp. LRF_L74 TaxID=3369422 RepID=UPI003F615295